MAPGLGSTAFARNQTSSLGVTDHSRKTQTHTTCVVSFNAPAVATAETLSSIRRTLSLKGYRDPHSAEEAKNDIHYQSNQFDYFNLKFVAPTLISAAGAKISQYRIGGSFKATDGLNGGRKEIDTELDVTVASSASPADIQNEFMREYVKTLPRCRAVSYSEVDSGDDSELLPNSMFNIFKDSSAETTQHLTCALDVSQSDLTPAMKSILHEKNYDKFSKGEKIAHMELVIEPLEAVPGVPYAYKLKASLTDADIDDEDGVQITAGGEIRNSESRADIYDAFALAFIRKLPKCESYQPLDDGRR